MSSFLNKSLHKPDGIVTLQMAAVLSRILLTMHRFLVSSPSLRRCGPNPVSMI